MTPHTALQQQDQQPQRASDASQLSSSSSSSSLASWNNAAVTLLEKGYVRQALQIFRQERETCNNDDDLMTTTTIAAARQQPAKKEFVMDVVPLRQDGDQLAQAVEYGPSSSLVFCFLMDIDNDCSSSTTLQAQQNAIWQYNTAMAYRCHYAETNQSDNLVAAQQALRACQHIVMQQSLTGSSPGGATATTLWTLTECALERVVREQERYMTKSA